MCQMLLKKYRTYQDLLNEINRSTLYVSRMKNIVIEMLSRVKKMSSSFLEKKTFSHIKINLNNFIQLVVHTSFGINSFRHEGTKFGTISFISKKRS